MSPRSRRTASSRSAGTGQSSVPGRPAASQSGPWRAGTWLRLLAFAVALQVLTGAAYLPALHGGMLWDDDKHITNPDLRAVDGLRRIWFDPGATQQYYPVAHSAFWLQHRLWGDTTTGYHATNVFLHGLSAFLLWLVLKRLAIPGAALAAAIFALHPVQVESVAWITELKNTLSGVFYLAAALAYLRFDETRRSRLYLLAILLFALALLSKTVTATLPASLLVVMWWQRGRLTLRRDVRPLLPFFALGILGGVATALIERVQIGAFGSDFQFTVVERFLIAGRATWFYLGKLVWPFDLMFIYPRWEVSQGVWWQYLFPIGAVGLFGGLWWLRGRTRAPLAALLLFCGALFPAAGFINVYPFRFSFVADHFQYLATLPVITIGSAGLVAAARRLAPGQLRGGAACLLIAALAVLTWNQSGQYADAESLYRTTISRNPSCWMARINLAVLNLERAPDAAESLLQEALRLRPDAAEAHYNLGLLDQKSGKLAAAEAHYRTALKIGPDLAVIHNNLGRVLLDQGRRDEAIRECERALQLKPNLFEAHVNLGALLLGVNDAAAEAHLKAAVRLKPDAAEGLYNLGISQQRAGHLAEAVASYQAALRAGPDKAVIHNNLCSALRAMGRRDEATLECDRALKADPSLSEAHVNLAGLALGIDNAAAESHLRTAVRLAPGLAEVRSELANTLQLMGRFAEARAEYETTLRERPDYAEAHSNLGNLLHRMGRPAEAIAHFQEAIRLKPDYSDAYYYFGNSLLDLGRFEDAATQYRLALKYNPNDAEVHNNLGAVLEAQGRLSEAAGQFELALRAKPDLQAARDSLARVSAALRTAGKGAAR